ncbi:MAG: hypothetical protein EZS28_010274 [Streblomastix strix]|uniref:Uncharacterized protein n=1 Tax=Streblomastix strix TaxID=222440 RepID=A0A5J4WGQ9_9EUKA|nr:MAG: hypothetical protein EZS28_010274 [Streblomastix strix]
MKATHLQQAGTIEETLLGNDVVPFTNDGEHHYSIKEIKPESQMPALFDTQIIINIKPITISIKSYAITEVTANMADYRATDAYLNRIRQFYSQRQFVVFAQRVEVWPFPTSATLTGIRTCQNIPLPHVTDFCLLFPKDARATTCFENSCYQNMQVTTCGRNFPDMPMNTLDQQFFQLQLDACNLDLLFKATDEFEDALTTQRNTETRTLNPHTDLTSFSITLQCERNRNRAQIFHGLDTQNQNTSVELKGVPIYQGATDSYNNIDTSEKRLSPPILCSVHDTFWLFSATAGGSCIQQNPANSHYHRRKKCECELSQFALLQALMKIQAFIVQ